MISAASIVPILNDCHPERSLAASKASCQTESKDPYICDASNVHSGNFRVAIRFFDEQKTECIPLTSREAAKECSPRRKPWEENRNRTSPQGAKENAAT